MATKFRSARTAALLVGTALLAACTRFGGSDWQDVPTPSITPGSTVTLRVAIADNERLPKMSPQHFALMLESARQTALDHFGVDIRFSAVETIDLARQFDLIPEAVRRARAEAIYDFRGGKGDQRRLALGMQRTFAAAGSRLDDLAAFAAPHLAGLPVESLPSLVDSLTRVMLQRLDELKRIPARDGRPVLDASPFNEWVYWDSLGYGALPYDVVVTNQLVASAEYYGVDIHSALRGGITVGTTTYSRDSRYGAYVMWSVFPYLDDSPVSLHLRGGERYTEAEAARLAGAYLAHEIGHLLFHFGHPFGQTACVMNPVRMLEFRAAQALLSPEKCRPGSNPQMQPGAGPFKFNRAWARGRYD